jgi:arylsulfatase A-like enzyme
MQENSVPVTYTYISDAHDSHSFPFRAFGPGEQGYVAQLQSYDQAFGDFFARLASDGITTANTLFIVTADEGDHFAGGMPINPSCNGSAGNYCTYNTNNSAPNANSIGEIDTNIQSLLGKEDPTLNFTNTPFDIHFDMAPVFYISGQPATGSPIARQFELDAAKLTAVNPITGNTDNLTRYLVDPVGMKFLHMITGDPLRTPTFIMFGDPDYYFQTYGPDLAVNDGFAWNHGGVDPKINTTFLGIVGPGVKNLGATGDIFTDHVDTRPTILSLVGLKDDYASQGRTISEVLDRWAQPDGIQESGDEFAELAHAYKRINAPTGEVGLAILQISTKALEGDSKTYLNLESQIAAITQFRDILAEQMSDELNGAEFHGHRISEHHERELVSAANSLADYANWLASH